MLYPLSYGGPRAAYREAVAPVREAPPPGSTSPYYDAVSLRSCALQANRRGVWS